MGTTTIYRINETDRTIDIAQSVQNDEECIHGAVLNTHTYGENDSTQKETDTKRIAFCGVV